MNVIFLDIEGVLETHHGTMDDFKRRITLLGSICSETNCKIVIESTLKKYIDIENSKSEFDSIQTLLDLFKENGIELIGKTPSSESRNKAEEIVMYLKDHPEIEHFCIIDDGDFFDLSKLREHLVKTIGSGVTTEEGLLPKHKDEVIEKLKI